jgi:hypothetical protein
MSADLIAVASALASLLQRGAAPDEIEELLQQVDPDVRDRVLQDAWRRSGLSVTHANGADIVGATEKQVGDTVGPGAGYDQEPPQIVNDSGIAES